MAVSQALSVTQVSQNVAGNSSQVRIRWTSQQTGDSWNGYTRTAYYYISINGGAETAYSISYTLPKNATTTLVDRTITVAHRADGTGSIRVRTWMDTRISAGVVEKSQSLTLTTIPRATTPALSATSLDMGQTLGITLNRATSSFTHDLSYKFEQASAWTAIASGVGASYSWTIPDLAAQIPDKTGGTIQIRCVTMNGTTVIGEKTASLTAMVPASVVPTISAVSIVEATAGIAAQFHAYIQNKSTLAVATTAAGAKGSTISAYRATIQGKVYSERTFTSEALEAAGTSQIIVQITDSRGRTASWTASLTVLELTRPQIQRFTVYRVDMSGDRDPAGSYLCAEYQYSVPSLNEGNTAALIIEGKRITETQYTQIHTSTALSGNIILKPLIPTFSPDYTYTIHIKVTDYFGQTAEAEATLVTEAVIADFNRSGKAISFGKTSEASAAEELFEVDWPTRFRKTVSMASPLPISSGGIGANNVAGARSNLRVPEYRAAADDLNTLISPGFYRMNTNANLPAQSTAGGQYGQMAVFYGGEDTVGQLLIPFTGDNPWVRAANGYDTLKWRAWRQISTIDASAPSNMNITGIKLLWENASKGSDFGAQTISVAGSGYDYYGIVSQFGLDVGIWQDMTIIKVGGAGWLNLQGTSTDNTSSGAHFFNASYRYAQTSSSSITFGNGQMLYRNTAYQNWPSRCVPIYVYGFKVV